MSKTAIEWTDDTWNPVSGCTRVSAGCDHCYAVKMTKRLEAMGQEKYSGLVNIGKGHFNGTVKCHEDALTIPLRAKKPRRWFVNSMSDLFHRDVPFEFIDKVFAVMALCPQHTFQVLTKRPERMAEYFQPGWTERVAPLLDQLKPNTRWNGNVYQAKYNLALLPVPGIWLGVSVESAEVKHRIDDLRNCPASVLFLSIEPLIGDVGELDLTGIDWVIVGGESGPGARPMHPDWARSLRDQCVAAGVPFFFKQWGAWLPSPTELNYEQGEAWAKEQRATQTQQWSDGHTYAQVGKKKAGRLLDGRTWDEFPEVAK